MDNQAPIGQKTPDGFTVKLARSKKSVFVAKGSSILFTLMDQGIYAPFSCGHGMCGACETDVLAGTPEHLDYYLSDEQRDSGKLIMICCSRSQTPEIELDL
jgi:ferredoxin